MRRKYSRSAVCAKLFGGKRFAVRHWGNPAILIKAEALDRRLQNRSRIAKLIDLVFIQFKVKNLLNPAAIESPWAD